jgi:endoglucanase
MKENGISWCNWSLNDRKETASALKPGTKPDGQWTEDDLTPSGKLIRKYIMEWQP